jgi:hypothetical protein
LAFLNKIGKLDQIRKYPNFYGNNLDHWELGSSLFILKHYIICFFSYRTLSNRSCYFRGLCGIVVIVLVVGGWFGGGFYTNDIDGDDDV